MSATPAAKWYRWDHVPREELHELLSRRLITGDKVMLAHVYLKKGCVVPKHSHMNEQFTYILESFRWPRRSLPTAPLTGSSSSR